MKKRVKSVVLGKQQALSILLILVHGVSVAQEYPGQSLTSDFSVQESSESIMMRQYLVRSLLPQRHEERAQFFKQHPIKSRSIDRNRNKLKQDEHAQAAATFPLGRQIGGLKISVRLPSLATVLSFNPSSIAQGQSNISIQINAVSQNGLGFFDPDSGFTNRLGVTISGGVTVTDIEYINPTIIALEISTIAASTGSKNITIINPDGQITMSFGALTVS